MRVRICRRARCRAARLQTRIQRSEHGSVSIQPQLIAALILLPFTVVFLYAGIHEYRRYKSEGKASYGLVYDEETGTTHVSAIAEGVDAYDPEDFDPDSYNEANNGIKTKDERS